jgi:hypothetical protein
MAGRRGVAKTQIANDSAVRLVDVAKALTRLDRDFRDANVQDAALSDEMREMFKEAARDIDRGQDAAFASGKLVGAIRELEGLALDEAIPESYQRVFKQILDNGLSVFDEVSAIAKLDLPLSNMKVVEVIKAIEDNAAKDSRLQTLVKNRPLRVAHAALARNNTRQMDLIQLRVLKDTAESIVIKQELDEIRTASDERLTDMAKTFTEARDAQGLRDRLRAEYLRVRREYRSTQRVIQSAEESARVNMRVAERMNERAVELSKQVGAFSFWEPVDGAEYRAMQLKDDGSWSSVTRTLAMRGDEIAGQHEQVRHDLVVNRLWLAEHRDDAGTRIYEEVKRQTRELSMLDFGKQYHAAHRFWLDHMLQPLGDKFDSTGDISGKRVKQMLARFQFIARTYADDVEAGAHKWTRALINAQKAAGYVDHKQFIHEVYDQVIYAIESEPGLEEAAALRAGAKVANRVLAANGFTPAADFNDKLAALMTETKAMSEKMVGIAEVRAASQHTL